MSNEMPPDTDKSAPTELLSHPSYEELMKKLDETEQKMNEYWERVLRMQAEADNAARRFERDLANAHKFGIEKFIYELLPIIDSLELSITNVPNDTVGAAECMLEGINLTLKMFYTAMEKFGIKQVNPIAKPFDPEFQQAISMQVDPNVKPGIVISVLQKGYTLNKRLIRPALVVVAKEMESE
jgi:molecular chaperone GrpE